MNRFQFHRIGVADQQSSTRPTLQECLQAVIPRADILMRDVLDGLAGVTSRTRLNGLLACPTPVSEQMRDMLCAQAPLVIDTFVSELALGVYSGVAQDWTERPTPDLADLKLLIGEQIDTGLESALALQEVLRCVNDVMPSVDALVSSLAGWTTVQPLLNPLKTEVFVKALLACLRRFAPDPKVRAALLMPCAGLLGVSLREFYRELCAWLRVQGVEPSWPVGVSPAAETAAWDEGAKNSTSRTMAILNKFRRLLSGEAQWSSRGPDFLPTVPFSYDALEELKLIKPMMQRLTQRGSQYLEVAVTEDLSDQGLPTGQTPVRQLSRQLGQEVVRLMLDSLLQNEQLLPSVVNLVRSLEPALLRLAQSDPRFFSDRQHPARRLVEWLVCRGLEYGSSDDPDFRRFRACVKGLVVELKSGEGGAPLFAAALRKLEAEWMPAADRQRDASDVEQGQLANDILDLTAGFLSQTRPRALSHP